MAEFLAMGGYAAFVWPSFGVTALVMAVVLAVSLRGLKENQRALDALKSQEGADEAEA
ncbi:MAG: heme exporter protein CcmD [Magnetospirillum sp. WYHS-4]